MTHTTIFYMDKNVHILTSVYILCIFVNISLYFQTQDMDIDEGQDVVEEEIFEQEEKKSAVRSRSRTHSRSRSRFHNEFYSSSTNSFILF